MSNPTKATILKHLNAAMAGSKAADKAKLMAETGYGSLTKCLNTALKVSGQAAVKEALFELCDDTSATAGNPYHKLGMTIRSRCKPGYSVRTVVEDDEIIDIALTRKVKGKKNSKTVDPDKAYDALTAWVTSKVKNNPSFAKAIQSFTANHIRKAVTDGVRDAK